MRLNNLGLCFLRSEYFFLSLYVDLASLFLYPHNDLEELRMNKIVIFIKASIIDLYFFFFVYFFAQNPLNQLALPCKFVGVGDLIFIYHLLILDQTLCRKINFFSTSQYVFLSRIKITLLILF